MWHKSRGRLPHEPGAKPGARRHAGIVVRNPIDAGLNLFEPASKSQVCIRFLIKGWPVCDRTERAANMGVYLKKSLDRQSGGTKVGGMGDRSVRPLSPREIDRPKSMAQKTGASVCIEHGWRSRRCTWWLSCEAGHRRWGSRERIAAETCKESSSYSHWRCAGDSCARNRNGPSCRRGFPHAAK
jgi:hypothetical protein